MGEISDAERLLLLNSGGGGPHTHQQADVTGLTPALAAKADVAHNHAQSDVSGLPAALAGKEAAGTAAVLLAAHEAAADPHVAYQREAERGQPLGYAGLDANGLLAGAAIPYGATSGTACEGDDARLSDARVPVAHVHAQADVTGLATALNGKAPTTHFHTQDDVTGLVAALAGKEPAGTAGAAVTSHEAAGDPHPNYQLEAERNQANGYAGLDSGSKLAGTQLPYGTTATSACVGNDSRLSDARTPLIHRASHISGAADAFTATDLLEAVIRRLRESGGQDLLLGAVADGEYLRRVGTGIVGATPAGGGATDKDESYYRQIGTSPFERWYTAGQANATALTTGAPSINVLRAFPLVVSRASTADKLSINVTTLIANGLARCGIYQAVSDTNIFPGSRIHDGGQVLTSTTGVKTVSFSVSLLANTLYWLVHVAGTGAATLRALALAGCMPILGLDPAMGTAPGVGFSAPFTYGSLPAVFPTTGAAVITATPIPAISLHLSG